MTKIDAPARALDQRRYALRKVGRNARLGMEGEDQRTILGSRGGKDVEPHPLAQGDEAGAPEREHREQGITTR